MMNLNNLESKVVSYKSAKKMSKLGWRKETVFCWVKLKGQKIPKLCHCNLKNDEQFYTVGNCQLIPFWDIENWCYAPLFCEIWEEIKNLKDSEDLELQISLTDKDKMFLYDAYITIKTTKGEILVELGSKFWCFLKQNGYIKEAWEKNEKT